MRRITLICLALPCVLLSLIHLAAAQNVTIQLTPQGVPIQIPATGGSFNYTISATNNGTTPQQATVWCMVTLPNGSSWGPVVGPATQTLAAGQTQGFYRTQFIPPRAPYGDYTFTAKVGVYPDSVWDSDSFPFEKLSAQPGGTELWVARYNGPGNNMDRAHGISVDANGNVVVAGASLGIGTSYDYATLKYSAAGNLQWEARYDGSASNSDWLRALVLDRSGNVYVTGSSMGIGPYDFDFATVKYNSQGMQQWVALFDTSYGTGAYALDVDDSGSVFVTGYMYLGSTVWDYATLKYNSAGIRMWQAFYHASAEHNVARALKVVRNGYVYVTGGDKAYVTIKYDSLGIQQWVARYMATGSYSDCAFALSVDSMGNVLVTGTSWGGGTGFDYATIKYDSAGIQQWVARYNGPGSAPSDSAFALVLDTDDNVYVTGSSYGLYGNADYATIKYDSFGIVQWVARYNGPANAYDAAHSISTDNAGNVYVAGTSYGSGNNLDYATIKYDAIGNEIWVARYNGSGNNVDNAYSLALDTTGAVYTTGESYGNGTNYDYATIKYSGGNIANWMPVEATILGQPLPQEFALHQNYPNPFNATTAISYELRAASYVSLKVYDTAGRLVATLVDGWRAAGEHELTFDASDLPSGMYVYRIQAGEWNPSAKMVLVK